MAIPALGMSGGPAALNGYDEPIKYGCSCHNNNATSDRAVVMITGVPVMYDADTSYPLTVTVADSVTLSGGDGNTKAGFFFRQKVLAHSLGQMIKKLDRQRTPQRCLTLNLMLTEFGI